MIISGTPGTGKSFFTRYMLRRLFRPDGHFVAEVPEVIVYYNGPGSSKGWIYRNGHFYKCRDLARWMTSSDCDEMLDNKNAWLIYDGAIPPEKPRCKMIVIISLRNLSKDSHGVKAFYESAPFELYFPTWTFDEIETAARLIHGDNSKNIDQIKDRYIQFGRIPRFVLEWYHAKPGVSPLGNTIASADVHKAVNDLGTRESDHSAVSGKLIHLIPSQDYKS
jgi:hypothetical protein